MEQISYWHINMNMCYYYYVMTEASVMLLVFQKITRVLSEQQQYQSIGYSA